jgi:hypothetical protein
MRKAINENRTVQLVLLGVLVLAAGLFLLKGKGGSSTSSTAAPAGTSATGTAAAPSTGTTTATTGAVDPSTGLPVSSTATAPASGGGAVPVNLIPGPGLPKSLIPAWKGGDAIVVLIRRAGGIDDNFVHNSVDRLQSESGVKVYVARAKEVSRYAWLTQGVDVTELPALIVLRPAKLTNNKPQASVSYGFRGPQSVVQAVRDQLYKGPTNEPYHPLG